LLKAITTCCTSSSRWGIWSVSLIIYCTSGIHRTSSHASTIFGISKITKLFIIFLINNFPCLFNLLIREITSQQKLIKLSRVRKTIFESQDPKLGCLSNFLSLLFEHAYYSFYKTLLIFKALDFDI
jgi:hypothetical protein